MSDACPPRYVLPPSPRPPWHGPGGAPCPRFVVATVALLLLLLGATLPAAPTPASRLNTLARSPALGVRTARPPPPSALKFSAKPAVHRSGLEAPLHRPSEDGSPFSEPAGPWPWPVVSGLSRLMGSGLLVASAVFAWRRWARRPPLWAMLSISITQPDTKVVRKKAPWTVRSGDVVVRKVPLRRVRRAEVVAEPEAAKGPGEFKPMPESELVRMFVSAAGGLWWDGACAQHTGRRTHASLVCGARASLHLRCAPQATGAAGATPGFLSGPKAREDDRWPSACCSISECHIDLNDISGTLL